MKLFDVNWRVVLSDLHRWNGLSLAARRLLLSERKTNGYVQAHRFAGHLAEIVDSGIPQYDDARTRLWLGDEQRDLVKVLRAMSRHPLFDVDSPAVLLHYLEEHFTQSDIELLASGDQAPRRGFADKHALSRLVSGDAWTGDLLAASTPAMLTAWATQRGVPGKPAGATSVLASLRRLAQRLLAHPGGMPLRELVAETQAGDMEAFAAALHVITGMKLPEITGKNCALGISSGVAAQPPRIHATLVFSARGGDRCTAGRHSCSYSIISIWDCRSLSLIHI